MREAESIPAKYIFLDIVGFSHGRSVEAQTDLIFALNNLVRDSLTQNGVPLSELILLPTGDGICIALLNIGVPLDIHLRIALSLLENLQKYNESIEQEMRRFQVRIGLNANTDNLVTDINGRRNIAGAGINMAQRVMSLADGNQILVGESVFETLQFREAYISSFRSYTGRVKHGLSIKVHQYIDQSRLGLNVDVPKAFVIEEEEKAELPLNLRVACYLADLIKNSDLIIQHSESSHITMTIMFWFRAGVSAGRISKIGGLTSNIYSGLEERVATFEQEYKSYWDVPDHVQFALAMMIKSNDLFPYSEFFEQLDFLFVNEKGKEKLKREWPDVWEKFELGKD